MTSNGGKSVHDKNSLRFEGRAAGTASAGLQSAPRGAGSFRAILDSELAKWKPQSPSQAPSQEPPSPSPWRSIPWYDCTTLRAPKASPRKPDVTHVYGAPPKIQVQYIWPATALRLEGQLRGLGLDIELSGSWEHARSQCRRALAKIHPDLCGEGGHELFIQAEPLIRQLLEQRPTRRCHRPEASA